MALIISETNPNWLELNDDVLELILKRLSFLDLVRFSAVCSSWRASARAFNAVSRPILLTLPAKRLTGDETRSDSDVLSKQDVYSALFDMYRFSCLLFHGEEECYHCIGSSKSMLVLVSEWPPCWCPPTRTIIVFNPFSGEVIRFPSTHVTSARENKAVVLRPSAGPLVLVMIYDRRITYCGAHEGSSWAPLPGEEEEEESHDIVAVGSRLYALTWTGAVVAWRFSGGSVEGPERWFVPREELPRGCLGDKLFDSHYLAESEGQFYVVRRILRRKELLYRTVGFEVYRACLDGRKRWERVEEGFGALFVGGNETAVVSSKEFVGVREDSIYFVDDHWEEDYVDFFEGYDVGVYSFKDRALWSLNEFDEDDIEPRPFWLIPNPL